VDIHENTLLRRESGGFSGMRRDWIEPILIAFILYVFIRVFLFQPFKIPSGSMEDTLLVGDQLVAAKFIYGTNLPFTHSRIIKLRDPRPGDVIVFKFPQDPSRDYIKRCIALGGQTVEIRGKAVMVDGIAQKLPRFGKFIDPSILPALYGPRDNYGPVTVPSGRMFVMGDNRDNSNDSRFWGFVPIENIRGKAIFIYWSWDSEQPLYRLYRKMRWNRLFTPIR
jgi:signal peptidase I